MIAAALLAGPALGDFAHDPDPALRRLTHLPRDVRVHIDRGAQCDHWAGEEGYDAGRRRQIEKAVRDLHCEVLDREDRVLRRRYAHDPGVLKALADSRAAAE